MEFCHVVGISCDGMEEKLVELFTKIEATRAQVGVGKANDLSGRPGNRGTRELKRLVSSVNYDGTGGRSSRVTGKGRGQQDCL